MESASCHGSRYKVGFAMNGSSLRARRFSASFSFPLSLPLSFSGACVAAALSACSPSARQPPPTMTTQPSSKAPTPIAEGTKVASFTLSPENLNVDKIGMRDGTFRPDGNRDLAFDAAIEGPFDAIFIVSCDAKGAPVYGFRADTLVGNEEVPSELGSVIDTGKMTLPVGVVEGGKFLNVESGVVMAAGGNHRLKLYVPNSAALQPGMHVRIYARSRGALAPGPFFEY